MMDRPSNDDGAEQDGPLIPYADRDGLDLRIEGQLHIRKWDDYKALCFLITIQQTLCAVRCTWYICSECLQLLLIGLASYIYYSIQKSK